MTARKRKRNRKESEKSNFHIPKALPYILIAILVIFILYRVLTLIYFKVDCSNIPTDSLSNNSGIVNTVFISQQDEKIMEMEVIIYSRDKQRVLRIKIPPEIYVMDDEVENFPISSMNSVGEFINEGFAKEYTIEYMSSLLGLKFDNYIWVDNSDSTIEDFLSDLSVWSILFNFEYNRELKGNLYSNLPILNLIKEINFIDRAFSSYQYENMEILDCCIKRVAISSNEEQIHFSRKNFDSEFSEYIGEFVSREVEKERVNVEVYNASDISGLASTYARKIRHTGCRILRFDNAPYIIDETVIFVPELEGYENSLALIRDVVGESVKIEYTRPSFITTGDIVVVLGRNLSN